MIVRLIAAISGFTLLVGCASNPLPQSTFSELVPNEKAFVANLPLAHVLSATPPESIDQSDSLLPSCDGTGDCEIIVQAGLVRARDGSLKCGVIGVAPDYINVTRRGGRLRWTIDNRLILGDFSFIRQNGIDIVGNDESRDFGRFEWNGRDSWRRILNLRRLKFHYNIQLEYELLGRKYDCEPYDPVIVNRD